MTSHRQRVIRADVLVELNQMVNEYYAVEKLDPSKLP
jgi:hypothetical protein